MNASRFLTTSATESPPNLRNDSDAKTSDTMASATTPIAGTAVTSVRSLNETVASLVATSTVSSTGLFKVARGFMAALIDRRPPVVMPPSMPPARAVLRTKPPDSAPSEES